MPISGVEYHEPDMQVPVPHLKIRCAWVLWKLSQRPGISALFSWFPLGYLQRRCRMTISKQAMGACGKVCGLISTLSVWDILNLVRQKNKSFVEAIKTSHSSWNLPHNSEKPCSIKCGLLTPGKLITEKDYLLSFVVQYKGRQKSKVSSFAYVGRAAITI